MAEFVWIDQSIEHYGDSSGTFLEAGWELVGGSLVYFYLEESKKLVNQPVSQNTFQIRVVSGNQQSQPVLDMEFV